MHYGNVAYRGTETSIKKARKKESKQARKREALVNGTRGRQEKKKRRNYVSKPFRAPLLAQKGLYGTERN
jgi:hypothetical protein